MPIYDYHCKGCGGTFEAIHRMAEMAQSCPLCGGRDLKKLIAFTAKPVVLGYYDEGLDLYVTGPRQKARHLKEHNIVEDGGRL